MIQRATFITTVLLKYFLFQRFSAVRKSMSPGVRMRLACEELGPVFIKMGQVMSTRYDLLKMGDAQELQKLLDSVPPVPYEEIKNVFVEDFGKTPDELYAEFHPVPIASASMSQVYKAKLYSGESVAVKVRRPGIKDKIVADIKVLKLLASIAGIFSSTLQYLDVGRGRLCC